MNASAAEILEILQGLGVKVTPIPPDTLRLEPASKVPPDLVPRIVECKGAILAALARPTVAVQPAECRHCEGKAECSCAACMLRRTDKPTPCSMCRWTEHRLFLAATRPAECWFCEERRLHGESGSCPNCAAGEKAVSTQ